MEEKLLKIINHYGINNQLGQFNEECFDLMEAIVTHELKSIEHLKGKIDELQKAVNHLLEKESDK